MVNNMKKCDFCTMSSPNGKCFWLSATAREDDCKKAIERMAEVLKSNDGKKTSNNRRF